ncbi:hypothetical protein [Paramagnetospirillum caucaseum]|uniref:hypothetical protein n=1 Tax=Paramagnetospirillum caucaseum TaxID=1244869 RepID=UPI00126845EE|nr:hypothetical protein [Paramagnetospirillum caucaseum]
MNTRIYDPQCDIDRRLETIGEIFPWRRTYEVDEEGFAILQQSLLACAGHTRLTDPGGGSLSKKHLEVAFAHVVTQVTAWFSNKSDYFAIKASCDAANAAVRASDLH